VRRALKVLSDREVSPQLGLLKSTLLQLDSTFSERTYGAGSFRDFAQKLAAAGHVALRESGRNVLVELAEGSTEETSRAAQPAAHPVPHRRPEQKDKSVPAEEVPSNGGGAVAAEPRTADGIREVRRLFQSAQNPPRWPMYIRQAKQFLRNVDGSFDERKFGFASLVDLLRACQRDGLFRIERDRQGVMRLFPGNVMQSAEAEGDNRGNVAEEPVAAEASSPEWAPSTPSEDGGEVVEGDVVQEMNTPAPVVDIDSVPQSADAPAPASRPARGGRGRGRGRAKPRDDGASDLAASPGSTDEAHPTERRTSRKEGVAPKARKPASRPRTPRTRARKETPAS
jgi:hypothetical protein